MLSRLYKYPAASAANNVIRASAAAAPFTSSSPSILPIITRDDDHEHPDDDEQHHMKQQQHQLYSDKNIRMEAIKSVGITQLHNATQDLILRTRQPLFEDRNPLPEALQPGQTRKIASPQEAGCRSGWHLRRSKMQPRHRYRD